jgi:hypothetical protein
VSDHRPDASHLAAGEVRPASLRHELIFLAALVVLLVVIALVIVAVSDVEASRAFPLTFVVGGGVIVVGGFLDAVDKVPYWYSPAQRNEAFRMSYVYAALGAAFVVVGIVLDSILS